MITIPRAKRHSKRRRLKRVSVDPVPPPPAPLTLVSANYTGQPWIDLAFERAIDVSGMDVAAIVVNDGYFAGVIYQGEGTPVVLGPAAVRVPLVYIGDSTIPQARLTAAADNGIVAADNEAAWAGCEELELPFP